jgi:N-acetylglucosaminyldiphosphoundecaprenol N-acetyl-beta-D-mannosaminyltransferase
MYVNVHVLNTTRDTPELVDALHSADIVYCDGEGVRVGARIAGARLPPRMTGADFIWDLAGALAEIDAPLYWLGGAPGTPEECTRQLAQRHPRLAVAGCHHGFFAKDGAETDQIVDEINAAAPAIVFVGMGTPVQELWVARYRARIAAPVVWVIGGTADVLAGVQPRGPALLTEHGFEWLGRLIRNPRRLFSRYVIGNPLFLARVLRSRFHRHR